jgi:hypothetical protein
MSDVDGTDDDFVRVELDCIKETRSAAAARIQEAARRRLEALTVADARGTALPDGVRTKWIPSGNDGVALEVTVAKKDEENRATQKQHALRVAMINSRKLRIGRLGTHEEWYALVAVLATMDVVVMQQVAGKAEAAEAADAQMAALLAHHSNSRWAVARKDVEGEDADSVFFVRSPIRITNDPNARDLEVYDPGFASEADRPWTLTSVEFGGTLPSSAADNHIVVGSAAPHALGAAFSVPLLELEEDARAAGKTETAFVSTCAGVRFGVQVAALALQMAPNEDHADALGHEPVVVCIKEDLPSNVTAT